MCVMCIMLDKVYLHLYLYLAHVFLDFTIDKLLIRDEKCLFHKLKVFLF